MFRRLTLPFFGCSLKNRFGRFFVGRREGGFVGLDFIFVIVALSKNRFWAIFLLVMEGFFVGLHFPFLYLSQIPFLGAVQSSLLNSCRTEPIFFWVGGTKDLDLMRNIFRSSEKEPQKK